MLIIKSLCLCLNNAQTSVQNNMQMLVLHCHHIFKQGNEHMYSHLFTRPHITDWKCIKFKSNKRLASSHVAFASNETRKNISALRASCVVWYTHIACQTSHHVTSRAFRHVILKSGSKGEARIINSRRIAWRWRRQWPEMLKHNSLHDSNPPGRPSLRWKDVERSFSRSGPSWPTLKSYRENTSQGNLEPYLRYLT